MPKHTAKSNRLSVASRLLMLLAFIVFSVGAVISLHQYQENKAAVKDSQAEPLAAAPFTNSPAPATDKPQKSAFESYYVAADEPRYIFIPKIDVRAMVKHVGLDAAGRIGAPANVHDAGWYAKSAKPGQTGAMVIDGHLSSWDTDGIFYNLKQLKVGDLISIERGDGQTFDYKIIKTSTYNVAEVDMASVLKAANPDRPGLNVITCAGSVIKGTNDFDKRLVVFTEFTQ